MPYRLPNAAAVHQRLMRSILEAQEARRSAVLAEMEMVHEEAPVPPEPPEASGPGAHEDRPPQPAKSTTSTPLHRQHYQVTSFKFHFQLGVPPGLHHSQAAWVRPCGMYPFYFMLLAYLVGGAPRAA